MILDYQAPLDRVGLDSQQAWCREAEARIRALTGEAAPDLQHRVRFAAGSAFEQAAGGPADGLLGFYRPDTGEIVVRDAPEAERQRVVVHEGLHAWQAERAGEPLGPAGLNEALTQHFTEAADPSAGREVGYEETESGVVRVLVPELAQPEHDGSVEVLRAPEVYPDATRVARAIESVVGRARLLAFYGTGDHELMRSLLDARGGVGAWDAICLSIDRRDWLGAHMLVRACR